jgi:hypothetical protein
MILKRKLAFCLQNDNKIREMKDKKMKVEVCAK